MDVRYFEISLGKSKKFILLMHFNSKSIYWKLLKHSFVSLFFFCQKIFFSCKTHNRFIWEPSSLCVYALIHKGRLNYSPHTLQYVYMDAEKLIHVWSTFKEEVYDKENNDKHVVAFVVAHFLYLGSNDGKEVNVFF